MKRTPFRLQIALLAASVSAVPLVLVGVLVVDLNAREIESSSRALQIALTEQVATRVDETAERVERSLAGIGSALTDRELDEPARIALALRLLDTEPELDVVAIYDASGELIDRLRDPSASDVATADRLDAALRTPARLEGAVLGEPTRDGEDVRVPLVVPLRAHGEVTGYALAPLTLAPLQAEVERLSRAHLAGDEGLLFVRDAGGRILAHPDRARLLAPGDGAERADARAPSSGDYVDADGRAWLRTIAGLERRPWAVVAQIPADVAYASLDALRAIVIVAIVLAVLLALAASLVLGRRLASPITKLVRFTEDLAARRFDRRVTIETGDELSVLGDALNGAAAELSRSEKQVREEIAIRKDLGRYLPAELVEAIIRREQSMELGGRRLPITVLFADVVAFTPLSDRLPPEQVVSLLNELFTLLTEAVFRHGGTVDKLIGDSLMAIWGAPSPNEKHARAAILAAQDMLRFVESASPAWKERYGVDVQLAIGVNTGDAVVGNLGSRERMDYTAIGDVVNVAARLETIARPQQILVSRATADAIAGDFELARLGPREVPGRAEPVELFEVSW
jgi:adenylate cyclase